MKEVKVRALNTEEIGGSGICLGRPDAREPDSKRIDLSAWLDISGPTDLARQESRWGFLEVRRLGQPVSSLERHCKTSEAFIPLKGCSVMVTAPRSDPADANCCPDETKLKAFFLDGSAGILFPAGCWHWAPLAISEVATFLILVSREVMSDIDERKIEPAILRF